MLRHSFLSLALVFACTASQVAQANLSEQEALSRAEARTAQVADEAATDVTAASEIDSPETLLELPAPIARAIEQGMALEHQFAAESELTGWVLSLDGQYTLVYTTPDQRTLISGALIDEAGENLSERYARQYFPKPDFSLLEQATYVAIGRQTPASTTSEPQPAAQASEAAPVIPAQNVVYAFFDPNSPFCQLAWKAFTPYIAQGLEVRWIPVAFLSASSRAKSAAILQAEQPEAALNASMAALGSDQQPEADIHERTARQLQENMKLMQRFGIQGTPGILWLDSNQALQIRSGMPKLHEFADITGLPEQPQTAPELARFR